jgi:hypothetical protein
LCHSLQRSVILFGIEQVSLQKFGNPLFEGFLVTPRAQRIRKEAQRGVFALLCASLSVLCVTEYPAIKENLKSKKDHWISIINNT